MNSRPQQDEPMDEDMQDRETKPKVTYICGGIIDRLKMRQGVGSQIGWTLTQ